VTETAFSGKNRLKSTSGLYLIPDRTIEAGAEPGAAWERRSAVKRDAKVIKAKETAARPKSVLCSKKDGDGLFHREAR